MKPTAEIINSAKEVLKLRAIIETLKPVVGKIQAELVEKIQPRDEHGNLLSVSRKWMMTDEYSAIYYPALDEAYKAAGFDLPTGYCPLLVAEEKERRAVHEMNKLAKSLVPAGLKIDTDEIYDMDLLKKLTDLNLKYICQFIKK